MSHDCTTALQPEQQSETLSQNRQTNMCKLNKKLLNNQWVKDEITKMIRKYFEISENVTKQKIYGMQQKNSAYREKYNCVTYIKNEDLK